MTNAIMRLLAMRYMLLSVTGRIEHPEHPSLTDALADLGFLVGLLGIFAFYAVRFARSHRIVKRGPA